MSEEVISNADTYRTIIRMEAKLDTVLDSHKELRGDMRDLEEKTDERLRSLEARQNRWMGAIAVGSSIVAFLAASAQKAFFG